MSASNRRPWPDTLDGLDALHAWVAAVPLGTSASWHRGDLALDRRRHPHVDAMAREIALLARAGLVRPFVVEIRPSVTCYRLTKTRERTPRRSLAALPGKVR